MPKLTFSRNIRPHVIENPQPLSSPPPPPPITKGTPHLHPKKVHNFRLRTIQNSCISMFYLMPPIPLPPPPPPPLFLPKHTPPQQKHIYLIFYNKTKKIKKKITHLKNKTK